MKYLKYTFIFLALNLPFFISASSLTPKKCYFGYYGNAIDWPIDSPLEFFSFSFDEEISLNENAKAYILHNGSIVANASSLNVKNYKFDTCAEGWLEIFFSGECLPKGETYTLRIESESICLIKNRRVTNDVLEYTIVIPSDLGDATFCRYDNGCSIVESSGMSCGWQHEIVPIGNPEWEIYRENELVRKYTAEIGSDDDMGYANLNFNCEIRFEYGINYRIRLPYGCVCTHREDIVNKEVTLDFVGGYSGKLEHPAYSKCSLNDGVPDTANGITFHYDKPIALIQGKPIVLAEEYQPENREWEALPELSDDGLTLTVNFGDVLLEKRKDYKIVIPEGTVVAAEGDITVNDRQEIRFTGMMSGVDTARSNSIKIAGADGTITVSNAPEGAFVQVFTPDGKVVSSEKAKTEPLTIEDLSRSIYIVRAGGIVRSVMLK